MRSFFSGSSSANSQSVEYRQPSVEEFDTDNVNDDYDDLYDSDTSYEDSEPESDPTFPSRDIPGHAPRQLDPAAMNSGRQQMPGQIPAERGYGSTGGQSSPQLTTGPPAHALHQSFPEWAMREPAQRYPTSAGDSREFNTPQGSTSASTRFIRKPVHAASIPLNQPTARPRKVSIPRKPVNAPSSGDTSIHAPVNTPAGVPVGRHDKKILIAVFGMTGTGKTSFIKTVAGEAANHFRIGHELESCTQEIETVDFKLDGRDVTIVDTPGFDDSKRSDTEILQLIADWLERSYKEKTLLSGIIYLHRISDIRMTNSSIKNLTMVRKLCGTKNMSKVCLMTTMWDKVAEQKGSAREEKLITDNDFWGIMLGNGASVRRHDDKIASAQAAIRSLMDNEPTTIKLQDEIVSEGKTLIQTDAGGVINEEIVMLQKKYEEELEALKEEMSSEMAQGNQRFQAQLQAQYERTISQIKQQHEHQQKLSESRMKNYERQWQEATQERERYEREARSSAVRDHELLMDTQRELEQTKLFVAEREREREHSFQMAAARHREELERQARERERFARAPSARELFETPGKRAGYDERPRRREGGGGRDGPNTVKSRSDNPPLNRQQALMKAPLKHRRDKYNGQPYYTLHCYMPGVFSNSGCGEGFDIVNPMRGKIQCCYSKAGGGGIQAAGTLELFHVDEKIIIAGLFVQIVVFGFFMVTAVIFQHRLTHSAVRPAGDQHVNWRRHLAVLYAVSALILVRSIFRVVEYLQGNKGYLITHEAFLYIFDAVLMALVMIIILAWYIDDVEAPSENDSMELCSEDPQFGMS